MRRAGILLDTGPLVALLSRDDARHREAVEAFAQCHPPLRSCEAVVAEACFLMRKVHRNGPAEVLALGQRGVYEISVRLDEQWDAVTALLKKYADRPISLADASLIRCADVHHESRILTFDRDFTIYRWARGRKFELM